ncbi:MAG: MSMEG_0568 family radical SAM protein [Marinobacter sp.]|nr:MSMEG_0568 family radical SAM protein [Marinobacter sp.]
MNQLKPTPQLITELQTRGLRIQEYGVAHVSRRGGAGPSDHQAVSIDGTTVMVPVYTQSAWQSPFSIGTGNDSQMLLKDRIPVTDVTFAYAPRFYSLATSDGVPYSHIATLHSKDVLATTVLQTCIRYESRRKACKFCSIGQSLNAGRTIAHKSPAQLAEVAKAAVDLDGVRHMIMTTGTPATPDRGAAVLCESAAAVKQAVDIPIQVQCEPPRDPAWYGRLKAAGVDTLGMHLEVVTPTLRRELMPGKSEITIEQYMGAFREAVSVFGRGQVSTYILAGLGDTREAILEICDELVDLGVYPFVVPFVPISGTPLEDFSPPDSDFMESILVPLGKTLGSAGLLSRDIKAGCGRCGACSTLSRYEQEPEEVTC